MPFPLGVKIQVKQSHANIDDFYGPYDSIQAALSYIPNALIAVGRTIGVIQEDKTLVEYWWMPDPKANPVTYSFVKKGANVVVEVDNINSDLEGFKEPSIYLVKNSTSGISYVLYVETSTENSVTTITQTLISSESKFIRNCNSNVWTAWVEKSGTTISDEVIIVNDTSLDLTSLTTQQALDIVAAVKAEIHEDAEDPTLYYYLSSHFDFHLYADSVEDYIFKSEIIVTDIVTNNVSLLTYSVNGGAPVYVPLVLSKSSSLSISFKKDDTVKWSIARLEAGKATLHLKYKTTEL